MTEEKRNKNQINFLKVMYQGAKPKELSVIERIWKSLIAKIEKR